MKLDELIHERDRRIERYWILVQKEIWEIVELQKKITINKTYTIISQTIKELFGKAE